MEILNFNLVLLWKLVFFEKRKNDTNFVKLWDWCELAYETYMYMLLHSCDLCIYLVKAFKFVWLVLLNNLKNDKTIRTLWILVFVGIGLRNVCVYTTTHMHDLCVYLVEALELVYFDFGKWSEKILVLKKIDELCQIDVLWLDNLY